MPELPDLEVHREALDARILSPRLERIRLTSPFLRRSVSPPLEEAHGRRVVGLRRLGKRLVFDLDEDLFLVLHLMIAGRLRWKSLGTAPPKKSGLAAFWPTGCCRGYSSRTGRRASRSSDTATSADSRYPIERLFSFAGGGAIASLALRSF